MDVTAHTAPSQQAVSLPLQGMEVWMNRHQEFFFFTFVKQRAMKETKLSLDRKDIRHNEILASLTF